ncbi:MAG: hypothetical protein RQ751_07965 [Longimicrobiales bacterium]|nr:hypothetical protein [Longimicrobiales bacterium]
MATLVSGVFATYACIGVEEEDTRDGLAQEAIAPPCDTCGLVLERMGELGDSGVTASTSGDAMFHPCGVSAIGDTILASARPVGGGEIQLFTLDGVWLRSVGRPGQGPGEFGRDLRVIPTESGGAVVVDRALSRVTVFRADWQVERVFHLETRPDAHVIGSEGDLFVHSKPHPSEPGPVVRFSRVDLETGEVFPIVDGVVVSRLPELRDLDEWKMAAFPDAAFVAAQMWEYVITVFDRDGSAILTVARDAKWMPKQNIDAEFLEGMGETHPVPPVIRALHTDAAGNLWVYILVPDAAWRPWPSRRSGPRWATATYDTRVEIIDLGSRRVLASGRFDEVIAPVCGSNYSFTVRETAEGDNVIALLKVMPRGG